MYALELIFIALADKEGYQQTYYHAKADIARIALADGISLCRQLQIPAAAAYAHCEPPDEWFV